ncbi:alpha/beta hydrolase [Fictibacillus sp. WQ 8-8]|uniref:alpha/beta hydrolase n=1 Tax=Fictibacillus sp. WQ 8-8 TaxID=2938788 RepID=UPI00210B225D|nr:alpha/beta hydrolase [Fictibacillus sp. WQ 8-8]MCQ6268732.1 alpha/beta hydrolase [Fictibacillus sp. WQ 8-8]
MENLIAIEVNGLTLRGMSHKPKVNNLSKYPIVIIFHGFTGSRVDGNFLFVRFARELSRQGIGCVRFDFSGSGESDGSFTEMTFIL